MDRETGWTMIDAHRVRVIELLAALEPDDWMKPSWCERWTVHEVASHLSLAAHAPSVPRMIMVMIEARGDFDRAMDLMTRRRAAAKTPADVIDDLRGIVGSRTLAPTTTWRDALIDVLVHTQDLARPLGLHVATPVEAAVEAATWVWNRGAPFRPKRHLSAVRLVADDVAWERGSGAEIHGPIASLLLLSTGRRQVLADLTGPGIQVLDGPARSGR